MKIDADSIIELITTTVKDEEQKKSLLTEVEKLVEEIKEEKELNKGAKKRAKNKFVAVQCGDPDMCYILQVKDEFDVATIDAGIRKAIGEFNATKKGQKHPIKTIGEAFEHMPAKFFKAQGLTNKSKTAVYVNKVQNEI